QVVVPFARDVGDDVAEEDRVGADTQVMLDLAEDDLLAGPPMIDDAFEPGMVRHPQSAGDLPQLRDERVGRGHSHDLTLDAAVCLGRYTPILPGQPARTISACRRCGEGSERRTR